MNQPSNGEKPSSTLRFTLALIVMFLGGAGLVYEYVLSTMATQILGNSIEQFSLIIATMLFAMGIAGFAQKFVTESAPLEDLFVLIEIILAVVGASSPFLLYLAFAYLTHFSLILFGLAFLVGFLIGLEIPLLIRLNERWRVTLKDNLGDVLSFDYVGALVGALIWALVLLPTIPLDKIALLLAAMNLFVSLVSLLLLRKWIRNFRVLFGSLLIGLSLIYFIHSQGTSAIQNARQRLYASPIQLHEQSKIQDIVFTGQGQRLSLYLNGHLQFDSEDEFIYHELLVHPAASLIKNGPKKVLILGGGDGLAVREALKWPTVQSITLVDLDQKVLDLAKTYQPLVTLNQGALLNERVSVISAAKESDKPKTIQQAYEYGLPALRNQGENIATVKTATIDADAYLRKTDELWDLIITDFPDPSSPDVAKLFSEEFFRLVNKRLTPNGAVAVQSSSPYANRRAYWIIGHTLESAGFKTLPIHAHVPTFGEWGWHIAHKGLQPTSQGFPTGLKYLNHETFEQAKIFAPTISKPVEPLPVSTRFDPAVLRAYLAGEPLKGHRFFVGKSYR